MQGQANVSIDNGTIQAFGTGVRFQGTVDCKLTNVTVIQNSNGIATGGTSSIGLTVTGCAALQNGNIGILFDGGTRASTITHNTANGNGFAGIDLEGVFANSVTDNATAQNGDRGINVRNSSGNTVVRNTSDRNGASGIDVASDSHGNTVTRNSCTANGDGGIRLIQEGALPTQNAIEDNTVSGSFRGIYLASGASGNTLQGNTANLNVLGIWLEEGSTGNTIQGNTALNNGQWDLGDQNANCDSNAWSGNKFVTDNVAGAPDGGPGAGCIR